MVYYKLSETKTGRLIKEDRSIRIAMISVGTDSKSRKDPQMN